MKTNGMDGKLLNFDFFFIVELLRLCRLELLDESNVNRSSSGIRILVCVTGTVSEVDFEETVASVMTRRVQTECHLFDRRQGERINENGQQDLHFLAEFCLQDRPVSRLLLQ